MDKTSGGTTMTLEDARNIATIAAAIIALICAYPLFRNLVASERNLRSKVFFDTLMLLEGKDNEVRRLRHILEGELETSRASGKPFDVLTATSGIQTNLDQLAREYDKVGLLVKHNVVPIDFLFDFYSRPIILAWRYVNPLINKVRIVREQKSHMVKFEVLAIGAALYRKKKYREAPPFSISIEDRKKWDNWRKWRVGSLIKKPSA
jgi:hypothetical protein